MKLSAKQALYLLAIAQDTLLKNLEQINFGGLSSKSRHDLVMQIMRQQDEELVDLDSPEVKKILKSRKLNIGKEE